MMYDITLSNLPFGRPTLGPNIPATVMLLHAPHDADKIVRLREYMSRDGWRGRPIIAYEQGDHHLVLNGTHRLCAAMDLPDLEIPVVWLPDDLTPDQWDLIDAASDDEDRLAACVEIARARAGFAPVVEAMRAEVDAQ